MIEIPIENTQGPALPVPTRGRLSRATKKPPKKFHMPDDVETGFRKASKLGGGGSATPKLGVTVKKSSGIPKSQLVSVPSHKSVLLSKAETKELEMRYQNIAGNDLQEVTMPDIASHPVVQRSLTRSIKIPHGEYTKRCIDLFKTLANSQRSADRFLKPYGDREPSRAYLDPPSFVDDGKVKAAAPSFKAALPRTKPAQKQKNSLVFSDIESDDEQSSLPTQRHRMSKEPASTFGDESEGEGDDLANNEEESEDSDMEASSSLLNFIAEDDEDPIRRRQALTKSSSPPAVSPQRKSSLEPVTYNLDSDDDSLPDISDLLSNKSRAVSRAQPNEHSSDEVHPKTDRRARGRRGVEDDSDD